MIKTEIITINGKEYVRTYSDAGMQIRQNDTGAVYEEAVDPIDSGRTYTETDEIIEEREFTAEDALDIIVGGEGV